MARRQACDDQQRLMASPPEQPDWRRNGHGFGAPSGRPVRSSRADKCDPASLRSGTSAAGGRRLLGAKVRVMLFVKSSRTCYRKFVSVSGCLYGKERAIQVALFSRVTLIDPNGTAVTLYSKKSRRKKRVSRPLRPLERLVRHELSAGEAFSNTLLRRHRRSTRKRRNGWLRNAPNNLMKAQRDAWKQLRRI
jgi:hypothetical protein